MNEIWILIWWILPYGYSDCWRPDPSQSRANECAYRYEVFTSSNSLYDRLNYGIPEKSKRWAKIFKGVEVK